MWQVFVLIILGIVQGASEFLPISSSGHLVVLYNIFNIQGNTILLSVILHVATLLAVIVCYFKDLISLIKHPFCKTNLKLITATIPTVVMALALKSVVERSFDGDFVTIGFLITALVLVISQNIQSNGLKNKTSNFMSKSSNNLCDITNLNISYVQALVIGIAQGVAIFPGISRSGSTIATGLITGVDKDTCADFSFLLSIPIILGSLALELKDVFSGGATLDINVGSLIVGFLVSFVSGLVAIKFMLKLVKHKKLTGFSVYLFVLSLFLILNKFVFGWF